MKSMQYIEDLIKTDRAAWRAENAAIKTAIEAVEAAYVANIEGRPADTVAAAIEAVGYDMAIAAIATLVNRHADDGRISRAAIKWAADIEGAFDTDAAVNKGYYSDRIHPAHLNQIAAAAFKATRPAAPAAAPAAAAGEYVYLTTARPPMVGAVPHRGLIDTIAYDTRRTVNGVECWGAVKYNRPLTTDEIDRYELTPAAPAADDTTAADTDTADTTAADTDTTDTDTTDTDTTDTDTTDTAADDTTAAPALTISTNTAPGAAIAERAITLTLDGIKYHADIMADDDTDDITVYIGGNYTAVYTIEAAGALAAYITGAPYNPDIAAVLPAPADVAPLRAAAREYQIRYAGKTPVTPDMDHADIVAAKKAAAAAKQARHNERDKKRAAACTDAAVEVARRWYTAISDPDLQRCRVWFARYPGAWIIGDLKAHGFSWNAAAGEWRRGYNKTAITAMLDMVARWPEYKKDLPRA